jgi:hypothetical protein
MHEDFRNGRASVRGSVLIPPSKKMARNGQDVTAKVIQEVI